MKRLICFFLIIVCLFLLPSCAREEEVELPLTVTVTFPEGYTVKEIAELLQENHVCEASEFISLTNNARYLKMLEHSFLKQIPNYKNRPFILEGYLFPDTYEFYTNEGAEAALSRFLDNTEQKLNVEYKRRAEEIGYTMDEILSLASIIQEEAGEYEHMPNVSSVLHNRLEKRDYNRLECDVTVNYISNNIKDSPYISVRLSEVEENYDTYVCYGLPLGAICNPGIHAIEAALYPPETDYFFFVTDTDWNYYYAETYEEHQENCRIAGVH